MTVNEARQALRAGKRLRIVIGDHEAKPDNPILDVWFDDGFVMMASIAGWSAGCVEPVCGIDSDYMKRFIESEGRDVSVSDASSK